MADLLDTDRSTLTWIKEWSEDGRVVFRLGRQGDDLLAEWVDVGTLRASRNGETSEFIPVRDLDSTVVEKFHRGLVKAFLRHLGGKLTLHGSAVFAKGRALVFIGESGAGKSTTAALLCAQPDVALIADDTAALEFERDSVFVIPTESVCWLTGESLSWIGMESRGRYKAPIPMKATTHEKQPLGAVIHLVFDDESAAPTLRRVEGSDAFSIFNRWAFRFVIDDPAVQLSDFDVLSKLAERIPLYEFRRRRSSQASDRPLDALTTALREKGLLS